MTQNNHEIIQPGELYRELPDGRWEIYIDHSKLNAFMKCEQLFYYRHILHIALRGEANWSMAFGSWWSSTMELCYKSIQNVGALLSIETVLDIGRHTWIGHKMDRKFGMNSDDYRSFGGFKGVIRILSEYYPTLIADARNWKIIAAEAGFGRKKEVCIGENDKVVVYYIGKPDLLVMELTSGRLIPIDHKTKEYIKSNLIKQFKPHAQTTGYIVVTEVLAAQLGINVVVDRCIINIAARKPPAEKPRDGVKKERFTRVYPHYSQEELQEWKDNLVKKATRLRYCIENNEWLWKEDSCHLYSGCSFRDIDSVTVGSRQLVIDTKFIKVEPWIPYEVEE